MDLLRDALSEGDSGHVLDHLVLHGEIFNKIANANVGDVLVRGDTGLEFVHLDETIEGHIEDIDLLVFEGSWSSQAFEKGAIVRHDEGENARLWVATEDTASSDEPGISEKWTLLSTSIDTEHRDDSSPHPVQFGAVDDQLNTVGDQIADLEDQIANLDLEFITFGGEWAQQGYPENTLVKHNMSQGNLDTWVSTEETTASDIPGASGKWFHVGSRRDDSHRESSIPHPQQFDAVDAQIDTVNDAIDTVNDLIDDLSADLSLITQQIENLDIVSISIGQTTTEVVTVGGGSYVDTLLSVTTTIPDFGPSTRALILVFQEFSAVGDATTLGMITRLRRGGTTIGPEPIREFFLKADADAGDLAIRQSVSYVFIDDSPVTGASSTYSTQFGRTTTASAVYKTQPDGRPSTIIVLGLR